MNYSVSQFSHLRSIWKWFHGTSSNKRFESNKFDGAWRQNSSSYCSFMRMLLVSSKTKSLQKMSIWSRMATNLGQLMPLLGSHLVETHAMMIDSVSSSSLLWSLQKADTVLLSMLIGIYVLLLWRLIRNWINHVIFFLHYTCL